MYMKKIMVTGANGFVGTHLLKELLLQNFEVMAIGGKIENVTDEDLNVEIIETDLTNPTKTNMLNFKNIDAVIHLAGIAAVGPSFNEPLKYINTNIGIQINLFESAIIQDLRPRFLIISSGSLYDPSAGLPLNEKSLVAPNSPYAVSKLGQEQMAQYYSSRGFECIIARPFNHIGPGQNLGFILPDLAKQVIGIENKVQVGNLDAKRDYTDVRDIVKAYRLLIEKGLSGEIYNICSGKPISGNSLLKKLIRQSGRNVEITEDPEKMRPTDSPIIYGSHDKLTKDTGWIPEIDINTTIKDVLEDWRTR